MGKKISSLLKWCVMGFIAGIVLSGVGIWAGWSWLFLLGAFFSGLGFLGGMCCFFFREVNHFTREIEFKRDTE